MEALKTQTHKVETSESPNCLNCGTRLAGPFCHTCRQRAGTRRLSIRSMLTHVWVTVFNVDRGIIMNLRGMLHPAHAVGSYILGQRVTYFDPLVYWFITLGLILFIEGSLGTQINMHMDLKVGLGGAETAQYDAGPFLNEWVKYIFFALVFMVALSSRLVFWRRSWNYAEHVISSAFTLGWTNTLYLLLVWLPGVGEYPNNIFVLVPFLAFTFIVHRGRRWWLAALGSLAVVALTILFFQICMLVLWGIGYALH